MKAFLREHIQSVEQIEILALMRNTPDRGWTAHALDEILRSNEQSIARRLGSLHALACLRYRATQIRRIESDLGTLHCGGRSK